VAVCEETINYIPYNDSSEGFVALNTSLLSPRTLLAIHSQNFFMKEDL